MSWRVVEKELFVAMEAFGRAWGQGDAERLAPLLSPSYTHTDAFGARMNRDEWLAYVARRRGRATEVKYRDVNIRRYGEFAVITAIGDISGGGLASPEDPRDLTAAMTQLWRLEDGKWLREAFQATPVLDAVFR